VIEQINIDHLEYYDSAREVSLEDDRLEIDIHVIGWGKKLRIRALTFEQMERIETKSTDAKGKLSHELWVYNTIKEGVVRPAFTFAQSQELSENNGHFVRELADEIWELGRITRKQWDAYMKAQSDAKKVEDTGNPDANTEDEEQE